MFGEILRPSWDHAATAPEDIKGYLDDYIDWEDSVYARFSDISNQLISTGFPCEANLVREGLPRKELERVRRMLTEYGLSGWDMAYILQADKELHDKIKKKEEA